MSYIIINGNNIDKLKDYPDNYFDSVVTDPPYGLGKEPDAVELMKNWIEKGYHEIKGTGFMGKEWDAFVPQPVFWKEIFRVLKHGGHVLSFFGTRTYDWGVMAMRFAGFEVRDCIQWLYGCLSDDTEILTKSGYIQYHKFIKLDNFEEQEICIYDIENDIYKWEKPERWNEYNINQDTCYRIKSDSTDQIVSRNHRCLVEREGKLIFQKAENLSEMEYMPTLSDDFHILQEPEVLQSSMQRSCSGAGMEEMGESGFTNIQFTTKQNKKGQQRRKESFMERGNNLSEKERILFGSETEICEMPKRVYSNGEKGWLCSGISLNNGKTIRKTSIENGVRSSHRPQSNEQPNKQLNAICNEQGTQAVRVARSYSTTLATITPFEYSGVIFCPTVSTGCFIARRNGKIFITGNSGFPKSHNISKAIDKMYGAEREVVGQKKHSRKGVYIAEERTEVGAGSFGAEKIGDITAPATEQAKQWDGWGSALKPANEPIVLARKPLEKGLSIAENVLKWGTGAINIDASRVKINDDLAKNYNSIRKSDDEMGERGYKMGFRQGKDSVAEATQSTSLGRFPANLVLSHHPDCEETVENWECADDCPIKIMDEQSGERKSNGLYKKDGDWQNKGDGKIRTWDVGYDKLNKYAGETGGASRFFYVAKASKSERNKGLNGFDEKQTYTTEQKGKRYIDDVNCEDEKYQAAKAPNKNFHPTVKPVKLMRYLVRLVTPINGKVLDPFCGSGTTGIACKLEGFDFVGIEQDAEYSKIAEARIINYKQEQGDNLKHLEQIEEENKEEKPTQLSIF